MRNVSRAKFLVLILAAFALAACSGGGGDTATSTDPEVSPPETPVAAPPPVDDIIVEPTNTIWSWGTEPVIPDASLGALELPAFAHLAPNPNPNGLMEKKFRIVWNDGTETPISSFTIELDGGSITVTQTATKYAFTSPGLTENSPPYASNMNWPEDLTKGLGANFSYTPVGGSLTPGTTSSISKIRMPLADVPDE